MAYQILGIWMRNSNTKSILWKIGILKKFGPKFWTKNQKKVKILENQNFFKLWYLAYPTAGIFDGEFKYGIHFVKNQNVETNIDQILNQNFKKSQNIGNQKGFKLWHVAY